jgi:hypothetical protein
MAHVPLEAAAVTDSGQIDRNGEFKPWLPSVAYIGVDEPGTVQYDGPKTPLMFAPDCCRSP